MKITTYRHPDAREVISVGFRDYRDRPGDFGPFKSLRGKPCAQAVEMKRLRRELGLNLGEAADRLDLTAAQVSGLERGKLLAHQGWDVVLAMLRGKPVQREEEGP